MTEDVLDFRQRGAAVEQHAGLGMSEVVRGRRHPDDACVALYDAPDRLRREAPALAAMARGTADVIGLLGGVTDVHVFHMHAAGVTIGKKTKALEGKKKR